jgi:radical SAM protein with 4Fe4S-binding SPASM domain
MPKAYRRANVEISNICNLKCSFCPEVERQKQVMQPESFDQLAEQLAPLVDEVCLHLMGEPLNHPRFAEFIAACARHELPVNLTTNGLLLHGTRREWALHPTVRQVNISVHSFEANFGPRDVSAYMERVFQFTREALEKRPDLYINLRLWDLTDPSSLNETNAAIRQHIENEFHIDLSSLKVDIRRRKNLPLAGRIYLHFDSRFTWPAPSLPVISRSGFCHGLSNHFGIHADGTVVPCCLDKEAVINLGNVGEQKLLDILQSTRAESIRQGFARGERVEDLCQRCPFIDRFASKARKLTSQRSQSSVQC